MIDIDRFKNLNDSFGHDAGDDAIRRIGRVLREGTRGIDLAARIGGEEFAVLLVETSKQGGFEVAERLRDAIKQIEIPRAGHITASFGVAECPTDAQTAVDILKAADVALYEAKRNGRDRVVATGAAAVELSGCGRRTRRWKSRSCIARIGWLITKKSWTSGNRRRAERLASSTRNTAISDLVGEGARAASEAAKRGAETMASGAERLRAEAERLTDDEEVGEAARRAATETVKNVKRAGKAVRDVAGDTGKTSF